MPQEIHLKNVRQLTFGGDNAEAYWSFAGDRLIMQTNHKPYSCDQIEEMPLTGAPGKLVSTGKGRTTCSYYLKGDQEIVYASTHESSPTCPTPPDMSKGYMWGLFDYDIYRANADGSNLRNLTPNTPGYDAEATVCPVDGSLIFTSDRTGDLELFRMDADGNNVRQLTHSPGYDGGAFFNADCTKIVWRSSRPTGKALEEYKALLQQKLVKPTKMDLYVANADGTDARQVTYLPGASFAPYFFPDGKRIIFASNFKNPRSGEFDLFAVNIDGTHLEQITFAPGFDGFPVFSPDGKTLAFSSNRRDVVDGPNGPVYRLGGGGPAGEHDTNVFLADWVDSPRPGRDQTDETSEVAKMTADADRFEDAVTWLADDAREGRGVGTKGLADARAWVVDHMKQIGVEPGVPDWHQELEVTTEIKRGDKTALALDGKPIAPEDFAPMPMSANASVKGVVVPVGWGITDTDTKLDDYRGKNVRGKIALVHRFAPSDGKLGARDIQRLGDLRFKAFVAKQHGAVGLLVIDDGEVPKGKRPPPPKPADKNTAKKSPNGKDPWANAGIEEAPLPKLQAVETTAQLPIVVIKRKAGEKLRRGRHVVKMDVALEPVRQKTSNIVGVIHAGAPSKLPGVVVVGAHLDHLGMGGPTALDRVKAIHNGADDNASGVAGLLEVARELEANKAKLQRDVYLIAFTAEEMGALGSTYYVKHPATTEPIVAMLNMDMIGRMKMNQLFVNGGDSAKEWSSIVQPICDEHHVSCTIGGSGYGPSDHMPFYIANVPVLFMFTGSHRQYHTAEDDAPLINASGGARVAEITADAALAVANRTDKLTYVKSAPEVPRGGDVRRRGAALGTVPSYANDPNQPKGMILSDVVPGGPAAKAGLQAGDRIIQIDTVEIGNVGDLMIVLQQAKPGTKAKITFVRGNKVMQVTAIVRNATRKALADRAVPFLHGAPLELTAEGGRSHEYADPGCTDRQGHRDHDTDQQPCARRSPR